jgi:phosphoadenosine phosphosulfate reductase
MQSIQELSNKAIELLKEHQPTGEYHLSYSGGKDSSVILHLAQRAGIRFKSYYYNVTIDPPELVRFIKKFHNETIWVNSRFGNLFQRLATRKSMPPTRGMRWCCSEFKGHSIKWGTTCIVGVRKEESFKRSKYTDYQQSKTGDWSVQPIVDWTMLDVWNYIAEYNVPYCSLYDEGFDRLGCVGCPLAGPAQQTVEFKRWPKYEVLWKRAIIKNWDNLHAKIKRDGNPYIHHKFQSGEELWEWWRFPKKR